MRLYVGNLSKDVLQDDLNRAFAAFGTVDSVTIITDKMNGVPKGFAFVEMPVETEAKTAITDLQGKDLKGKTLNVNEARPRADRSSRGSGAY